MRGHLLHGRPVRRWPQASWLPLAAWLLLALAGCASGPVIDTSYSAKGQDSRALFLILHYTDEGLDDSIRILTQQAVSSHYLLSDESPPRIFRLVDENRRAWHAGASYWKGNAMLNSSSIGIEIVNPGQETLADGRKVFAPYPKAQIDALLVLVKDIVARHQIRPERILGHSDIAPQRKIDPGPEFPWQRLADEGLIPWPDAQQVAILKSVYEARPPDLAWFREALATHGFQVPVGQTLDEPLRRVISAFQMKYRPANHDGLPDAETAALLQVLNNMTPR